MTMAIGGCGEWPPFARILLVGVITTCVIVVMYFALGIFAPERGTSIVVDIGDTPNGVYLKLENGIICDITGAGAAFVEVGDTVRYIERPRYASCWAARAE